MTIVGYANLDQFRPASAQAADFAVLSEGSDVTAVVEWGATSEQAIFTRLPKLRTRSVLSSRRKFGNRIRNRHFRAVRVHPEGLPAFWVVVVHMPPKRMQVRGPLYVAYSRNLRRFLRSLPGPKVVVGDWNKRVSRDPAGLRRAFGGRWYGSRIDGAWVHPALVPHVPAGGWREVPQPERTDRHPFCFLTLI